MFLKHCRHIRWFVIFLLVVLPVSFAHAAIVINEFMYDVSGTDTDHEWVEIYNTGSSDVDITGWKFNDGSNHVLNAPPKNGGQGSLVIPAESFTIFSGDALTFLADHPGFTGTVIDTVMSLNNTGATLQILDAESSVVDSVTYSKDLGAVGDGNSLQKSGSQWLAASPTPGVANTSLPAPTEETAVSSTTSSTEESEAADSPQSGATSGSVEQTIFPDAGVDKTVVAGAMTVFSGHAVGVKKEPLVNAHYLWNFGDGGSASGQTVSHIYKQPGQYVVYLEVSAGEKSNLDRATMTVIESPLRVSAFLQGISGYLEITNTSASEIDMSWWQISDRSVTFVLPKNTIILPRKTIRFSNEDTKISQLAGLKLLYPSGTVAAVYSPTVSPVPPTPTHEEVAPVVPLSKSPQPKKDLDIEPATSSLTAAVSEALPEKTAVSFKWFIALGGLILLSVSSVLLIRARSTQSVLATKSGFEIIEDEE